MKIAIFHNYLDNIGGAEIFTLSLAKMLKADIFTTNIDSEKIAKMGFDTRNIFSIGKVPINAPFKQQFSFFKFWKLNLEKKYDLYIISGDWAFGGARNHKPNIWYVHSPIRELFDSYDFVKKRVVPFYFRPFFIMWAKFNRFLIKKSIDDVEKFVCNSRNVKARIKKYFKKESVVIHPMIDVSMYKHCQSENYWLSVNRLLPSKRIEMQIEAFQNMPDEKLIIIGSYEEAKHFKKYAKKILENLPSNVEIKSWVTEEEKINLYSRCIGLIATALDEDFGYSPVEAMASGKPTIAPNEGGYRETAINNKTGLLIDDINSEKIISAIKQVKESADKYKEECLNQAKLFDSSLFEKKFQEELIRET